MDETLKQRLIEAQRNEITEYHVYTRLAASRKDLAVRSVLERIGNEERGHYEFWARHTGEHPGPRRRRVWWYVLLGRIFGVVFSMRLMEKSEERAEANYDDIARHIPDAQRIAREEKQHEETLLGLIDEEHLRYVGSVVLGLNDALVELTGALAGMTLALGKTDLIAPIGLITGLAAAMSMAASEYLSTKADEGGRKTPGKAAVYTGVAYFFTVLLLILPFLLLSQPIVALGLTVLGAMSVIAVFTYYISVARDMPFWRRFTEMAGLSLSVAAVSFGIGYVVRVLFGVDV